MVCWTVRLRAPETVDQRAVTVKHCVYCFGGDRHGKEKQILVHVFNTVTLIWSKLTPVTSGRGERNLEAPTLRFNHTTVLIEDTVYLWGGHDYYAYFEGYTDTYCDQLHVFDVDVHTWFTPHVSGTVPKGRSYHTACVLGNDIYIHGGYTQTDYTNDIHKLDTTTMIWTLIDARGTTAPFTEFHSASVVAV